MLDHKDSIEILKSNINDINERITFLKEGGAFEYTKEVEKADLQKIDNLQGTIAMLMSFTNQPLKLKNNTLRLKATKSSDEIKINVIKKEGKEYAIVPLEILPSIIKY